MSHILVTRCNNSESNWGDCVVAVLDVSSGESEILVQTAHNATYADTGHIIFVRDGALWAVPFDPVTMELVGAQVPVIQGVEGNSFWGHFAYSFSESGRLVYVPGGDVYTGARRIDITWVSQDGDRTSLPLPEGVYGNINLSPDQSKLALTSWTESGSDVWIWDLDQEILGRLTFEGNASTPIWTRDGRDIVYMKTSAPFGIWAVASDGTSQPQQILETQQQAFPETISDEGEILYSLGGQRKLYSSSSSNNDIQTLVDIGPAQVRSSRISDDGNWLLYTSNESGDFETFIRPWPDVSGGKWQASRSGGGQPLWDQDSNTIYFWSSAGRQYSVEYEIQNDNLTQRPSFRFREPVEMFAFNEPRNNQSLPGWTYSSDRGEFLMVAQGGISDGVPIAEQILADQTVLVVIENWFDELEVLAPPDLR